MDYSCGRLEFLLVYWILTMIPLLSCQTQQGNNQSIQDQRPMRPDAIITDPVTVMPPMSQPQILANNDTKQDIGEAKQNATQPSMPMLQWMRRMIFKSKTMYLKHKLEFELSGCLMNFIRKIISVIYNTLYNFNKKLIFSQKIKIDDIIEVASSAINTSNTPKRSNTVDRATRTEPPDEAMGIPDHTVTEGSGSGNRRHMNQENNTQVKANVKKGKTPIKKVSVNSKNNKETNQTRDKSNAIQKQTPKNGTTALEGMYVKLYNISEKLEGNINKMNEFYHNISIDIDILKITMKDISEKEIHNGRLNSKYASNIKEDVAATVDKLKAKVSSYDKSYQQLMASVGDIQRNQSNTLDSGKMKSGIPKQETNTIKSTNIKGEFVSRHSIGTTSNAFAKNSNEPAHNGLNRTVNSKRKVIPSAETVRAHLEDLAHSQDLLNIQSFKQNQIADNVENALVEDNDDLRVRHKNKTTLQIEQENRFNFTQEQIKLISQRVHRVLNEFRGNHSGTLEYSSREFTQDSILESINSVILYFMGFVPEEESMEYFMSMLGEETANNLLRIGSGFNAMRTSQLVSCMSHYGRTKFWNWVDGCC